MKIPHTIPRNVYETYKCSTQTRQLMMEINRAIHPDDDLWDISQVPSLKTLALNVIALSWKQYPILDELPTCADRNRLMEILPTDLPLELIVRIDDEHYWERCSKNRWEHNDPTAHGNSWRRRYCEGVLTDFLQQMEPAFLESQIEECQKIITLISNDVHTLELRFLQPTKKSEISLDAEDLCEVNDDVVHHIPLEIILPKLPRLTEIRINFGLIYMNDGFEWRDFEISIEDCTGLGEGIKRCSNLRKLSLSRCNLDRPRIATLLHGILDNDNIEEIDLSHCKLKDKGAIAIGEFLSLHKTLRTLHLANNDIGPDGISGIVHGLLKREHSVLRNLDLKLNPLSDAGAYHICAYLLRNETLEFLDISACAIEAEGGVALAEIFSSNSVKLKNLTIRMSNNQFNEAIGKSFEEAITYCHFVVGFEARMCNFSEQSEYTIYEAVLRNKLEKKKEKVKEFLEASQKSTLRFSV